MTSEPLRALSEDERVLAAVADLGRQLLARKPEVLREITARHDRSGVEGRVVAYSEPGVAVVSVLARDREATRQWVHDVLGPLAVDDVRCRELRRTLRIYLQEGESYARAAEVLHLHRNSVKYRVTKALRERPEALAEGKTDLAVALQVCYYLGPDVLISARS